MAVIVTQSRLADALMQAIALENNLSETAFLVSFSQARYQQLLD